MPHTLLLFLPLLFLPFAALSAPDPALTETRFCGLAIPRDTSNRILRRSDVLLAYRKSVPCPSTGQVRGPCPGWNIDHVWPLARGGCDAVPNLQWLPVEIKRCAAPWCKDRWERTVYPMQQYGTGAAAGVAVQ